MDGLLVATVLLPLVVGVALALIPGLSRETIRATALVTVVLAFLGSLLLAFAFDASKSASYQFARESGGQYGVSWVDLGSGGGIRFALGLDGVSLSLFVLTTLLMITCVCSSWESIKDRAGTYYALLLALESGLLGLFASLDVVLFYIFFEFTLIPLFFLIGLYGGPERRRASVYFFLYTLAGSLLTLLGVIGLVVIHYLHANGTNVLSFSIPELTRGLAAMQWDTWREVPSWSASGGVIEYITSNPQILLFLLLFAGFAIKIPLFPFHTWLPLAHVEAPTAGSILLAGVLLKVGGYGFLRFNLAMTPIGAACLFPLLAVIAVTGIIYGALTALAQSDIKRLVAYSSVSHMGFVALGLFSLNLVAIDGAVIQMINHGLTTGALFACVGILYERYHTREMNEVGGLWNRLPLFAFFLILSSLGSAALPGLNGFVGEFPILLGAYKTSPVSAMIAAVGMVLGAYYLLWMLQKVLFGPLKEPHGDHAHSAHHETVAPVAWYEILGLAPLLILIVAIGVYPKPIFDRITPAVAPIAAELAKVETYRQASAERAIAIEKNRNITVPNRGPTGPQ